MTIFYHPRFHKSFKELPEKIKERAEKKMLIFKKDPYDSRLKTHKLHGKLQNFWSFSVSNKFRIIFEFDNSDIIFLDIGDHDLYK